MLWKRHMTQPTTKPWQFHKTRQSQFIDRINDQQRTVSVCIMWFKIFGQFTWRWVRPQKYRFIHNVQLWNQGHKVQGLEKTQDFGLNMAAKLESLLQPTSRCIPDGDHYFCRLKLKLGISQYFFYWTYRGTITSLRSRFKI